MSQNVKLKNVGNRYQPKYEVMLDGNLIGTVLRSGSLPSMHSWWAFDIHGRQRNTSSRTRSNAVEKLIAAVGDSF